jgi:hypothetical protein
VGPAWHQGLQHSPPTVKASLEVSRTVWRACVLGRQEEPEDPPAYQAVQAMGFWMSPFGRYAGMLAAYPPRRWAA